MKHRPLIRLSQIRKLAHLQVTVREAAAFFGVGVNRMKEILETDKRAAAAWEEGQQRGKIALRRKQFNLADKNSSMAIFLGKQWLNQSDIVVTEHSGRDGGPIVTQSKMDLKKLGPEEREKLRSLIGRARKD